MNCSHLGPLKFNRKVFLALLGVAGALTALAAPASSLMLRVTKQDGSSVESQYRSGSYTSKSGSDTVQYLIDVVNGSTGTVTNVKIHWAILVRAEHGDDPHPIVEGNRACNLDRGEKFSCGTDVLELSKFYKSSYGGTDRYSRAEIEGYFVEVTVNGQPAASESRPADIKQKIEAARTAKKKAGKNAPAIHKF